MRVAKALEKFCHPVFEMLQLEAKSVCTLGAGISGSGKTTFSLRYLVADSALTCRFIFDPEGEFSNRLGLPAAETEQELLFATEDGFVVFDPHTLFPGNLSGAFEWFCDWTFKTASQLQGRKLLHLDEAWKYCSPHSIPFALSNCIQTGRKRGLEMSFSTQRPNKLNEAILNETTELVCFRIQGQNALETVAELGADKDEVAALQLGSFVSLNVKTGGVIRGRLF